MSNFSESSRASSSESFQNEELSLEVKFTINLVINNFFSDKNITEFEFPSSLTRWERSYVHKICKLNGLASDTKGKGNKKCVYITKKSKKSLPNPIEIKFSSEFINLLKQNDCLMLSVKEQDDLIPKIQKPNNNSLHLFYKNLSLFDSNQPQVPKISFNSDTIYPISIYKQDILKSINANRFLFIAGDNGIGKTSQIGQYILEFYQVICQKCRIIHSVPSDLQAYSTSFRVSEARKEILGDSIGCHLSNKKITSQKTLLTYCTHEILLKNFMNQNDLSNFYSITHIILDELHAKDRYSEYILILLKDLFFKLKHIKFILIGSAQMAEHIQKYFITCNIYIIPHIVVNYKELFLNDVLSVVDFNVSSYAIRKEGLDTLEKWCNEKCKKSFLKKTNYEKSMSLQKKDINLMLERSFLDGIYFKEILEMIKSNEIDVNIQHTCTMLTVLMSAAVNGMFDVMENLIRLGANINLRSCNEFTAADWAKRFAKNDVVNFLDSYQNLDYYGQIAISEAKLEKDFIHDEIKVPNFEMLKIFYQKLSESWSVIFDILVKLIKNILEKDQQGSILIYLSNYEEIAKLEDMLLENKLINIKIYKVFSDMNYQELEKIHESKDQKLILTTYISEYLSTFDNVTSIIDCGLDERRIHNEMTNSNLKKATWISKQSAFNRINKSNKSYSIVIYRLYNKLRFKNLCNLNPSEFVYHPLQELCLLSKQIIPFNTSITDLITKGSEYPAFLQLRNSINSLKVIDALDTWEDMTDLGLHLINLNIDLKYSKAILYSLILKCLNPILVIISIIINGSPFIGDLKTKDKVKLINLKKSLLGGFSSDHLLFYRVYLLWKKSIYTNNEKKFCSDSFLNSSILHKTESLRIKLLMKLKESNFIRDRGLGDYKDLNSNSQNVNCIKAALAVAFYPNILRYDEKSDTFLNDKDTNIKLNSDSSLWSLKTLKNELAVYDNDWYISDSLQMVKNITFLPSRIICLLCGPLRLNDSKTAPYLKIDNFLNFNIPDFDTFLSLRKKFNSMFIQFLKKQNYNEQDEEIKNLVFKYLNEDEKIFLHKELEIFDFSFRFNWENNKNSPIAYFMSESSIADFEENSSQVAKVFSNNSQNISNHLKESKKIFVFFVDKKESKWLGYGELILTNLLNQSELDLIELNEQNTICSLKLTRRKIHFDLSESFVDALSLKNNQEIDENVGFKLLSLLS